MCAYEQNIVIDLEFNPTPRKVGRGLRFEIIEIGAVKSTPRATPKGVQLLGQTAVLAVRQKKHHRSYGHQNLRCQPSPYARRGYRIARTVDRRRVFAHRGLEQK